MKRIKIIVIASVLLLGTANSKKGIAQVCEPESTQSALQYLRRASLDFRGHLPSIEELESVVTNQSIDAAIIENMVESDAFLETVRAYHRDLLWANVNSQRLTANTWRLTTPRGALRSDILFLIAAARATSYRGSQIPCQNKPQSELGYDPISGIPNTETTALGEQEGYVEVSPYWAPNTRVKVCAFDAQENLEGTGRNGQTVQCNRTTNARDCGCGPSLKWCHSRNGAQDTERYITNSWNEQIFRFVENIVSNDQPYSEILTGNNYEVNGPTSNYFLNLWSAGQAQLLSYPIQNYTIPEVPFSELENWQPVTGGLRHAGLLTLPAFLVKFQTNRSRANRFYNAFLCQEFQAPEGGLPASDDECNQEPNLSERCGCDYCHQTLEPAAAHWGRWVEAGVAPLNEDLFPKTNDDCLRPGARNSLNCRRFYLTQAQHPKEEPYVGQLISYMFATAEMEDNIEKGPEKLARAAIDSGAFASCTVKNVWKHYVGKSETVLDESIHSELTEVFKQGYDLKALVKNIVTRSQYVDAGLYEAEE